MQEVGMQPKQLVPLIKMMVFSIALSGGIVGPTLCAQTAGTTPSAATSATPSGAPTRYHPSRFPKKAGEYYELIWGVDSLTVKAVESGELIRFTYRVVNPDKARVFNDKKIEAFLDSPKANARLVIPSLEKVGQLRQVNTPESGRLYWMAFSNPRRTVKRGDHVNVVIGQFHADGLVVE
jgi:hypothetical protein